MGLTHLQQILKSLCLGTDWKYAAFWKLKQRARMILTLEDAYYDNHEQTELPYQMRFQPTVENLQDDPLGLALAKMSYLVHSLGEGIVGQVAATGKHQWMFTDSPVSQFWSSSEYCDGWKTQFSAGIKTIAVVAVVPHGVVQLGSLNTVVEDMKLVTHVKDVFYSLQNSNMELIPCSIGFPAQKSLCLLQVSSKSSSSEITNDIPQISNVSVCNKGTDMQSHILPSLAIYDYLPGDVLAFPSIRPKNTGEMVTGTVGCYSAIGDAEIMELSQPESVITTLEKRSQVVMKPHSREISREERNGWRDMIVRSDPCDAPLPNSFCTENPYFNNFTLLGEKSRVDYPFLPSNLMDSTVGNRTKSDRVACVETGSELLLAKEEEHKVETSCNDTKQTSLKFSAGCELHEVLGPTYKKHQDVCNWSESDRTESAIIDPSERESDGLFTIDCGSEYLLEAVVANACTLSGNAKNETSLCKPAESLLTTGKTPQTYKVVEHCSALASQLVAHSSLLVEDDVHQQLNLIWDSTEVGKFGSPKESSSKTLTAYNKQSEIQREPTKITRKRARPGESCRPRPRDRQLIQDRVKELRDLVPNGSKCSIDSLLERTIKHMLFLQSMTKHADKLKKCDGSKVQFLDRRLRALQPGSHEHGSSWAIEVGGQIEVCPIVVENLSMHGQMLVKMLCEEYSSFLEIAEAIRSLGLTILKGVTETHGEKIWACFVVEGKNNKSMHRMDVLWSLMQLLQPKNLV